MTAQDFTPGPWDALVSDFGICNGRPYVTVDNGSASICLVVTTDMSGRNLPFVANAHLISAAPEMAEALSAVKTLMSRTTVSDLSDEDAAHFRAIQWQVDAALSKARPAISGGAE